MLYVVVTSIRTPTTQVKAFLEQPRCRTVFVADSKTPEFPEFEHMDLLSAERQRQEPTPLTAVLPWKHYARKNLGYLHAIRAGASAIFDTDDDNRPLPPWTPTPVAGENAYQPAESSQWVNAYAHFGARHAWPRGYPLEHIGDCQPPAVIPAKIDNIKIWQGLVSGDPDVDAIFRLTRPDPIAFTQAPPPLVLPEGSYCPFNSQNTWWHRDAFPYLYLPATVTFRFTDILRGLVAQRCLWSHGWHLGFQKVTAHQDRNAHNLLLDFADEIPCYLLPAKIARKLDSLSLTGDPLLNLKCCYQALADEGWVPREEIELIDRWNESLRLLTLGKT